MKVVILAGGVGSRLSEETESKPKPMVEVGPHPILWHIMQHYGHHGFDDFVICLGYKGDQIKRFFADSVALSSDLTVDFARGVIEPHGTAGPPWRVRLIDTGLNTQTGGRLAKIRDEVGDGTFLMTYGDGVSNVDLTDLVRFHREHGLLATVTAVHPIARFGHMDIEGDTVTQFHEKPQMAEGWVNGGFFVLEPEALDFIEGDYDWAREPMEKLVAAGQLAAYRHEGFWQCMDTLRDKVYLSQLWERGNAPWATWTEGAS